MNGKALRRFWDWKTWALIGVTVLLTLIGIVLLFSTTGDSTSLGRAWLRQCLWFCLGTILAVLTVIIDYRFYLKLSYLFYAAALGLLILTLVFGSTVYGSQSWLEIPFTRVRIQPSEFAKIAIIVLLARVLARKEGRLTGLRDVFYPLVLVAIPVALILKQPDLGTAVVLFPIMCAMFYMAGLSWVYLIFFISPLAAFLALCEQRWAFVLWLSGLVILGLLMRRGGVPVLDRLFFWVLYIGAYVAMPRLWDHLKPHQKSRFLVFWDPTYDLDRAGYNLLQSKIAIGSGGFWGKGFGQGTQSRLEFLPEYHTDFTFAVLAEDWGFLGCLVFFALS